MERQFFSGNSLEQAVLAAARHYGLDPSRVVYSVRDKKHGFLNIRRRVVIEVDPEEPELSEEALVAEQTAPEDTSQTPVQHRQPDEDARRPNLELGNWRGEASTWVGEERENREVEALEKAVRELSGILGMALETSIRPGDDGYEIELSGPDSATLSQNQGSTLVAVEHLLPRMVRGLDGKGVPCRVDSEGFRADHEHELKELALTAAAEVHRDRRERRLEPMNPADRRTVHLALAEDPAVRTESEGQGFMKRVAIIPS